MLLLIFELMRDFSSFSLRSSGCWEKKRNVEVNSLQIVLQNVSEQVIEKENLFFSANI